MRSRPERLTAFSAFAALALGASGTLFERAGPSVLTAEPEEFSAWARQHHDALVAQSAFFALSCAPLLLFFAGLRAVLAPRQSGSSGGRVDLSLVVLAGGALWVMAQLLGQAIQVAMATAAARGEHAGFVAALGDLMTQVLALGNIPLAAAVGACAALGFRRRSLPGWLAGVSAGTSLAHLTPVATAVLRRSPSSGDGILAYLTYPAFAGWMGAVAVTLRRQVRAPRRG